MAHTLQVRSPTAIICVFLRSQKKHSLNTLPKMPYEMKFFWNIARGKVLSVAIMLLSLGTLKAQSETLRLWEGVPGMSGNPARLYVYLAPDSLNTGVSVLVCPGGSYAHTMGIPVEGFAVAEWLNSQGINAFVLKYRVGLKGYHYPAMLEDVQYAIRYIRQHAEVYHLDPDKLGTMGFSAGGHLVTMSGAFAFENILKPLGIADDCSLRPDFVVPVYPVVSMQDAIVHRRSRRNLLTRRYTEAQKTKFSLELNVPKEMPPVFLVTAKDDPKVDYRNSVCLDQSLTCAGVPHRFLLYETGGHGYGMSEKRAPEAGKWKYEFVTWLQNLGILPAEKKKD